MLKPGWGHPSKLQTTGPPGPQHAFTPALLSHPAVLGWMSELTTWPSELPHLPVQQCMVQVLAQALEDLVVVPDGRGLIFTCSKVALQLQKKHRQIKRKTDTS